MNSIYDWERYNNIDGVITKKVWDKIAPDLESQGYRDFYEDTIDLIPVIIFMQTRGIRVDREALKEAHEKVEGETEEKQRELERLAGRPLNANSTQQCARYLYDELGNTPYMNKSGGVTTDDKALARLARKGVREARLIQQIRAANKLTGTYLEVRIDSDDRVRSSFDPRGTSTGRLSSSQTIFGTGLNFQNLPPAFKVFLVPDEGYVFLELDKRQAEWVVTAYASGDPNMIAAVEAGLDIHTHTGHLLTLVDKDLIIQEHKLVGTETDADTIMQLRNAHLPNLREGAHFLPRSMSIRQCGKRTNHACNYKMGHVRAALEWEIPETEAKPLVDAYRRAYSHLPIWWENVKGELLRNNRTLVNCFGQPRRFLDEMSDKLVGDAVAYIPQSTVVKVVNNAMRRTYWDVSSALKPVEILAQVHDSILVQYPIGDWNKMAEAVLTMRDYLNPTLKYHGRQFNIETDLKMGVKSWGHAEEIAIIDNVNEMADRLREGHESATK